MTPRVLRIEHDSWWSRSWRLVEDGRTVELEGRAYRLETKGVFQWTVRAFGPDQREVASFPMGWRGHGESACTTASC